MASATTSPLQPGPNPELENKKNYTLADLEELANKYNPTLVQAQAQVKGELGKALQAGLPPNPALSYLGDLLGLRMAGLGEFEGGLLSQEIILGGKLKYSRKKYQARADAAKQELLAQELRVVNDVRAAYFRTLASQERLHLEQELMKTAKDGWLTCHEMLNLGQANEADIHEANIDQERQRLRVLKAENELALAWQELTTVVGIDRPYQRLEGSIYSIAPEIVFDNALAKLLAESPQLGEAKMKLKSDVLTVQREKRQPFPNAIISGGPGYDQQDHCAVAMATVSITNIPILNRNQGTIQQAKADLERQRAQVRLVELNLRRQLAMVYKVYKTARQVALGYQTTIVPEARSRYEINLKSYMNTRLDWQTVLASQKDYADARVEYINYLLEYHVSRIQVEGMLLTGGLVAPPGITPPGHIDATPQPR